MMKYGWSATNSALNFRILLESDGRGKLAACILQSRRPVSIAGSAQSRTAFIAVPSKYWIASSNSWRSDSESCKI